MDRKAIGRQRIKRHNDFFRIDTKDFDLSLTEIAIWCCVYNHVWWPTGTARLSYSRCADNCHCSEITARRTLKALCDKHLLKRLMQGKGTASSVYALLDQDEMLPQTLEMLRNRKSHPKHTDEDDYYDE